jgi:hypothetical protein
MKFLGRIWYIVPGNFVGWRIGTVDESLDPTGQFEHPDIPKSYVLDNVEPVLSDIGISVEHPQGPFCVPVVKNDGILKDAVFEFEKTAGAKFRLLRYVGRLKVTAELE